MKHLNSRLRSLISGIVITGTFFLLFIVPILIFGQLHSRANANSTICLSDVVLSLGLIGLLLGYTLWGTLFFMDDGGDNGKVS